MIRQELETALHVHVSPGALWTAVYTGYRIHAVYHDVPLNKSDSTKGLSTRQVAPSPHTSAQYTAAILSYTDYRYRCFVSAQNGVRFTSEQPSSRSCFTACTTLQYNIVCKKPCTVRGAERDRQSVSDADFKLDTVAMVGVYLNIISIITIIIIIWRLLLLLLVDWCKKTSKTDFSRPVIRFACLSVGCLHACIVCFM